MSIIDKINFTSPESILIEASAGTGKTWTLERLFIKAILTNHLFDLSKILVVTFTNIATAELKDRIKKQIETTVDAFIYYKNTEDLTKIDDNFIQSLIQNRSIQLEKDIAHLRLILNNFDIAKIITIHGFCNYVLNNYQVESSLVVSPQNIVNNADRMIYRIIQKFILINFINNPQLTGYSKDILLLLQIIFGEEDIDSVIRAILSKIRHFIHYKEGRFRVKYKTLNNYNLSELLNDKLNTVEKELIVLSALLPYIEEQYNIVITTQNNITQNDLVSVVADLLTTNQVLRDKLYQQFPIVFIDEFQDTDIYQWAIFNQIYNIESNIRGNVVLVGDPKQAIYSFRGADINTYLYAKSKVGRVLSLVDNYRSHPDMIKFINCLFDKSNLNYSLGENIIHHPVSAKVDINSLATIPNIDNTNHTQYKDMLFSNKRVQIIPLAKEYIIKALVFEILVILKQNPNLIDKIAILVYKKSDAKDIMHQLNIYGIRAVTTVGNSIFATQIATDLYNLLLAISDLSNHKQLKLAISSNLFSIPYKELLNNSYLSIINLFLVYQKLITNGNIISFIYQLIADLSQLYQSNNMMLPELVVNQLLHLAELLTKKYQQDKNISTLLYWFKIKLELIAQESEDFIEDDMELVRLDNNNQQITILTYHKAKGLEFDIVFCPFFVTMKEYLLEPTQSLIAYSDISQSILTYDIDIVKLQKQANFTEKQRLNYVALTRAKSRMYIYLQQHKSNKDGSLSKQQAFSTINYLFGLNNPNSNCFNYNKLVKYSEGAILNQDLRDIVSVLNRQNIMPEWLEQLSYKNNQVIKSCNVAYLDINRQNLIQYKVQSYSSLVYNYDTLESYDKLESDTPYSSHSYKYQFLDKLSGADFGILMHNLLEKYPFSLEELDSILTQEKIIFPYSVVDLYDSIVDITNYKIYKTVSVANLEKKQSEFTFSLTIDNQRVNIKSLRDLILAHYGANHPYSLAISSINNIDYGFLNGAIDLVFMLEDKYYILDYKTNILHDYTSCNNGYDESFYTNPLLLANSHKHYYLQYFIYLLALKRYLELKLNIDDATHLIGGAIYYYVRASCIIGINPQSGVFVDTSCQALIKDIDNLFRGDGEYHVI